MNQQELTMKNIQRGIIILLAMLFSMSAWADNGSSDPKSLVENTITQMINVLEQRADKSIISDADRAAIRQTVEGRFDYAAMSRKSLGKPWKKLDESEHQHFTNVFRDLLEYSYGNRLGQYHGQEIIFADAEFNKKKTKAKVKSTVIDGERKTPVEYRLHQTASGWQIYDIRIEGTSMVRTFHQDFKSALDNDGYVQFLKALEEKVAKLKAKGQS